MPIDVNLIESLRDYLKRKTGKLYFKNIRKLPNNIMITCPFHKDGQENKPSCGIRITEDSLSSIGTVHCFTCGETMNLSQMVQRILGDLYDEDEVEAKFGLKMLVAQAALIQPTKIDLFEIPKDDYVPESILRAYRTYHPYLAKRGISKEIATMYDLGYDDANRQITFPIRDIYRHCLAVGRRSIDKKEYRYPSGFIKPLYGVYELDASLRYLWIVEGPFNLWSLREWGKQGVAMLGTGTEKQFKQLLTINCVGYVIATDGDDAGRKSAEKIKKFLQSYGKIVHIAQLPDGKDINDLTKEEFRQMEVI